MATILNATTSSGLVVTPDNSGQFVFQNNGANPVTLPSTGTGTIAVQGVSTNIVNGTAVATTSGTTVTVATLLPAYIKRITLIFSGVDLNGTSDILVQLGTGSSPTYATTGYLSSSARLSFGSSSGGANSTTGLNISADTTTATLYGSMVIQNVNGNTWVGNHTFGTPPNSNVILGGGQIALGAALTAVRLASSNGSDAFSAGSINIFYE